MKGRHKLELCKACEEWFSCQETCKEAIEFEAMDNSNNYSKEKYKATGVKPTFHEARQSGGFGRFR